MKDERIIMKSQCNSIENKTCIWLSWKEVRSHGKESREEEGI